MNVESTTTTKHVIKTDNYTGVIHNTDGKFSARIQKNSNNEVIFINDENELGNLLVMVNQINEIWE